MGSTQEIRVHWSQHRLNIPKAFSEFLNKQQLCDVTLSCDGKSLSAHKVILAACSPYFHDIFLKNPCKHPVVIMRDFRYEHVQALLCYMYKGEVKVEQNELRDFLTTAYFLQVKGLNAEEPDDVYNRVCEEVDLANALDESDGQLTMGASMKPIPPQPNRQTPKRIPTRLAPGPSKKIKRCGKQQNPPPPTPTIQKPSIRRPVVSSTPALIEEDSDVDVLQKEPSTNQEALSDIGQPEEFEQMDEQELDMIETNSVGSEDLVSMRELYLVLFLLNIISPNY